jgi:hypothetical protein
MTTRNVRFGMLVLFIGMAWWARADDKARDADDKAIAPAMQAQLDRELPEIRFGGQALSDIIDFLRDVSGANIYVDWRAAEAAGIKKNAAVNVQLRNVKFSTALTKVLESVSTEKAKLVWRAGDGVIVITTPERAKQELVTGKLPPDVDRRLPEANFNNTALSDVIDFLRDVSGANLFVNWVELEKAGLKRDAPVSLRLRDMTLSSVLRLVLESANNGKTPVRFTYEDNVITVTAGAKEQAKEKDGK